MQAQCSAAASASASVPTSSSAVPVPEEVFSDSQWPARDGLEGRGLRGLEDAGGQCEMGTLTELHNSSNMPEVELFSLLEEKIPMYKLRADTTSALTYEHSDWLRSSGRAEAEEDPCELLSPIMMEETLKYFTLCGDRVVQMTRTYNDIEAVTRLLEEKEKDLELAAKIGQSLLEQNKQLEKRIDTIEEQFTLAADQNTQLKHDMKLKEQLLRIYTNEVSYSDSEEDAAQSTHERTYGLQSKFINVEALQKKVRTLEEENFHLRMETAEMKTKTVSIEEKEAQLVQDAFKQLGEAQGREGVLTDELSRRLEETYQQKEEITCLLAQIVDLQQKVKKLSIENEELQHQYQAAREAQQSLTKELQETKDKNEEYVTLLNEARTEAKAINRRSMPKSNLPSYSLSPLPIFPPDSLAAELVDSMEQEMTGGMPKSGRRINKKEQNKNIMKTVKELNKVSGSRPPSEYSEDMYNSSRRTSPGSSVLSLAGSQRCDTPLSDQYEGDNESNNSPSGSVHQLGRAGIPGSNDLETALRRLNLRKENEDAELRYAEAERRRRGLPRAEAGADEADGEATAGDYSDGCRTPTCPSPGSLWSTESFGGLPSVSGQVFKSYMPEKLQIVKPMEGSLTLYHWQRLAQPHMASMLDVRPGVMVKGFRELDRDPTVYSMDDVEDDGRVMERTCVPSKCYVSTCSTYTYTTSTIGLLDNTQLTSSAKGPRMANTEHLSKTPRPAVVAAKTFSTSLGLAHVLKERGMDDGEEAGASGQPRVLTKVEAAAINPAGVNAGLNMFGAATAAPMPPPTPSKQPSPKSASEARRDADSDLQPRPGMHRISSRIFSRFAVPVRPRNITDALDPETKSRLMEKVRRIRAEKATSERRARTLQGQGGFSIPSVRTKDVVMSPVRSPKPPSSSASTSTNTSTTTTTTSTSSTSSSSSLSIPISEATRMGLEGAVGGYSPPGAFGSHTGTVHRNTSLAEASKISRKLFGSDDSGVELGFGTPSPLAVTSGAGDSPFKMCFRGTVSTTMSVPGFNTVLSGSRPGPKEGGPLPADPRAGGLGILGALGEVGTLSSGVQVPRSVSFAASSHSGDASLQRIPRSQASTGSSSHHVNLPSGKSTGQQAFTSLMSSSSSLSTTADLARPRTSVMPVSSLKSSAPAAPPGGQQGLACLMSSSSSLSTTADLARPRTSVMPISSLKSSAPAALPGGQQGLACLMSSSSSLSTTADLARPRTSVMPISSLKSSAPAAPPGGQQGLACLMSSSSLSTSADLAKPRTSVVPISSLKSSAPAAPAGGGSGVGLAALLGTARPSELPVGEQRDRGKDQANPGQPATSPMPAFVGNLSSAKGFRKQGPVL